MSEKPTTGEKYDLRYYEYLESLRESGKTNMLAAAPWLARAFVLPLPEARQILSAWMAAHRGGAEGAR